MGVNDLTEAKIAEFIELAEATPRRIAASSAGLDDDRLKQRPASDEWSALEILNHLRACQEVWTHSIYAMLAHDEPRLKEIHPRQWIKTVNPYTSLTFADSLQIFTMRREELLVTLRALSTEDWARECRIERKTHTVFSHVRRLVLHEQAHCEQIEAVLKGK